MSDQEELDDYGMDVDQTSQANTNEKDDDNVSDGLSGGDDSSDGDSDIDAEVELYEKYAKILDVISTLPFVYDNYVELVRVAQYVFAQDFIHFEKSILKMFILYFYFSTGN